MPWRDANWSSFHLRGSLQNARCSFSLHRALVQGTWKVLELLVSLCLACAANGVLNHMQVGKHQSSFCVPMTLTPWAPVSLAVGWVDNILVVVAVTMYFLKFILHWSMGFPDGTNLPVDAREARGLGSIPKLRRSPRVGNGNLLQYSCLENAMDGGACWATAMGSQRVRHD